MVNSRCGYCNKKSFVMFDCKCEKHFCAYHRLPEKHECMQIYEIHRYKHEINRKKLIDNSIDPSKLDKLR